MALDERRAEHRCIKSPNDSKSEDVRRGFDRTGCRHAGTIGRLPTGAEHRGFVRVELILEGGASSSAWVRGQLDRRWAD